jgi:folate-dependent phosphoribosylglycinamide formyltransferase PurN
LKAKYYKKLIRLIGFNCIGWFYLNSDNIIAAYTNKVINIHPALLPKYGGKGMV